MSDASKEQEWAEWNRKAAEQYAKAQAAALEAGRAFMDSWTRMQPAPATPGAPQVPFQQAGEAWMRAVAEAQARTQQLMAAGKSPTADEFVDIWTKAATEVGTRIVEDPLFARMTGETVTRQMAMREEAQTVRDAKLREMGFATSGDVSEVGKRLVEMERRIHELTLEVKRLRKEAGQ